MSRNWGVVKNSTKAFFFGKRQSYLKSNELLLLSIQGIWFSIFRFICLKFLSSCGENSLTFRVCSLRWRENEMKILGRFRKRNEIKNLYNLRAVPFSAHERYMKFLHPLCTNFGNQTIQILELLDKLLFVTKTVNFNFCSFILPYNTPRWIARRTLVGLLSSPSFFSHFFTSTIFTA